MKQFEKRPDQTPAIAIQINLKLEDGIYYKKWGGKQTGKQGDWLVCRDGETYTIDQETFARTYTNVGPGQYIKTAKVWAEQTDTAGKIATKEGFTDYEAGDWLVYNEADRKDGYAVSAADFEAMYQPVAG